MTEMDGPLDYTRVGVLVVLVIVNLALFGAMSGSSTALGPYNGEWDGAGQLRTTAADASTVEVAISTQRYVDQPASETVGIVLTPERPTGRADIARVRQFLTRGGTLVVAGENATRTNPYLDALGARARLDGRLLRDEQSYHRSPELPVATNVTRHTFTTDVEQVTLNHGTVIEPNNATTLVNTSQLAYLDGNGNGSLDDGEPLGTLPVVTVERVGSGQVVVVSDASVFTNAMLERPGNEQFVTAVVDGSDRVLLDYSGSSSLPPLTYTLLFVRTTPLAQTVLGLAGLGAIVLWTRRATIESWLPTRTGEESVAPTLSAADVTALLRERHPEWDDQRIERVAQAIIRQRGPEEYDD